MRCVFNAHPIHIRELNSVHIDDGRSESQIVASRDVACKQQSDTLQSCHTHSDLVNS